MNEAGQEAEVNEAADNRVQCAQDDERTDEFVAVLDEKEIERHFDMSVSMQGRGLQ